MKDPVRTLNSGCDAEAVNVGRYSGKNAITLQLAYSSTYSFNVCMVKYPLDITKLILVKFQERFDMPQETYILIWIEDQEKVWAQIDCTAV